MHNYFDKNHLHHAYLIEGDKDVVVSQLLLELNTIGIDTVANPDLYNIQVDTFKMEDAKTLKSLISEKSFSEGKRVYIVSANNFLLEAQNTLLKAFEEPAPNTHFFVITPTTKIFIPTLLSRFYIVYGNLANRDNTKDVESFIKLSLSKKIDFIKDLIASADAEDEENQKDSPRVKALEFLDDLEALLHKKFIKSKDMQVKSLFNHIFQARKYLRQPGSATKTILESVALGIPEK